MMRIAYVSTYVPKRCGLATYTYHLRQAVQSAKEWRGKDPVVVLTDPGTDPVDDPVLWPLKKDQEEDYAKMARKINHSDVDVVALQHEFGIFGGEAGGHILTFIRNLKKPLITTFHTVFERPQPPYAAIQREIADRSAKIIVMNRKAIDYLHEAFGIPKEKITFIPHGTPEPNPEKRQAFRQRLGWNGRKVLMTFGLLSRGKGIELILKALPEIASKVPDVLYAIVGQTHPEVKKREGERYREELWEQIRAGGMEKHVLMVDRYMEEADLVKHLMSCDVYVTPYPGMQQITSGTLAYAVGLGRPVLTTPYSYAQDLLADYPEPLSALR
ncbi:glycosyltransferase [Paenibacillus sp. P26]|nr:glycosyltransferase [Paenibacillus sp. P26]